MGSAKAKVAILFITILVVISATFSFAIWHHDDGDTRVHFKLTSHTGESVSQDDLGGQHLLVFFGFTSCLDICPTQMSKITQAMSALDASGHGLRIKPVFVSVDPERDSPEKMADYLAHFDERFIGLTGSRTALKSAANSFKTLLQNLSDDKDRTGNYQISHSSIVYIVDPFGRVIDYLPGTAGPSAMANRLQEIL